MDTLARMATGFLLLVNTILLLFVSNMLLDLRAEVNDTSVLATKDDLLAIVAPTVEMPFKDKCTRCHSEQRFANLPEDELQASVHRMRAHAAAGIEDEDIAGIQASLTLMKCTVCHDQAALRKLALMGEAERLDAIQRMRSSHGGPPISREEAERIVEAYSNLMGSGAGM